MSERVEEQRPAGEPDEQAVESVLPAAPPDVEPVTETEPVPDPEPMHAAEPEPDPEPVLEAQPEPDSEAAVAEPDAWTHHAPGELDVPGGYGLVEGQAEGAARRSVGIVVARFHGDITQRLLDNALGELDGLGVLRANVTVMMVPGAFELPLAAMALAKTRRYACIVALGCVIRGATSHFEYVAGEAASGLQLAALETGVPVAFGILTCETREQAEERLDKGAEAVRTGLEMAHLFSQLRALASAR
jgi:6,7-dimethyl-8-ribityllumazine synthase